jgi:hypothetical protein
MDTLAAHQSRAARTRWHQPAVVDRRVATLAEHVTAKLATFPPLTDAQRSVLRDAFAPVLTVGRAMTTTTTT